MSTSPSRFTLHLPDYWTPEQALAVYDLLNGDGRYEDIRLVYPEPLDFEKFWTDAQLIRDVACGGGGIPVTRNGGGWRGLEAVIDKDMASSLLACALKADAFLLLTDVDGVYVDWGEPEARRLAHLSPEKALAYEFAPGSMAPKVKAACDYVQQTGGIAGIGALEDASAILRGAAGTRLTRDRGGD